MESGKVGDTGFELPRFSAEKSGVSESGGSKSGNTGARFGDSAGLTKPTDPELAAVAAAWPDLPPALRAGIVAMVNAATPPTAPSGPADDVKAQPQPKKGYDAWNGSH
ncbi:MAG: hypothetical protein ACK4WH_13185 [Phycisphaerales bacterium]